MNNLIIRILAQQQFPQATIDKVLAHLSGPSRHYHNVIHINEMLTFVERNYAGQFNDDVYGQLQTAIIFHDVIYDPRAKNSENERNSYNFFHAYRFGSVYDYNAFANMTKGSELIQSMIMATADHDDTNAAQYEEAIILADLDRFNENFEQVWEYTMQLFREYAFVDWADFKEGRLKFLTSYAPKILSLLGQKAHRNVHQIITAMSVWEPRIAIMPGSFNPWHIGHQNIMEKAEKIFDKVIIARGINPEKPDSTYDLPDVLSMTHQIDTYEGLLTDYIKSKPYPVTVVRGLRNSTDLQAEITQYRYMQDLDKNINVVCIICDAEVEHVSSTGVRLLQQYNKSSLYTL